ncbi:MAG: biopolymer transporter ExbD [Campylobacterales bacterium]|nr:biopolymer transporter ExbD [Campylobacterales bacterium]
MRSLKKVEGINVVPLIDIMLVLLAIVLTISSFIALGKIEIALPQASSQIKLEQKRYDISISADKQYFINKQAISKEELMNKINEIKKDDIVAISADKQTPYEEFIFVVDSLKQKGIEKISMVVEP